MSHINKDNNNIYFKLILLLTSLKYTQGSTDGTFIPFKPKPTETREECKPLYWYPKHIPAYCYYKDEETQKPPEEFMNPPAIQLPIPVPIPAIPPQIPSSYGPVSPPYPGMFSQPMQLPYPLPFGIPIIPTNPMLPVAGIPMPIYSSSSPYMLPFPSHNQGIHVTKDIHGLPGIMTHVGGMNILPFTDVITDLLQKHKKKMLLKRLKQMSDEYDRITAKDFNNWQTNNED